MSDIKAKIVDFIKNNYVKILIVLVPLAVVVFLGGLIAYNQSSKFCYTCHINEGPYAMVDKQSKVHKGIDKHLFTCIKCHKDKTVQVIYQRFIKRNENFLESAANLSFATIKSPRFSYTSEQCLNCHPDRLDVVEIPPYLLKSDKLRKIGLKVSKRIHHDFEYFTAQEQTRLEQLKLKSNPTAAEKQEIAHLEKVRIGYCGQCHQRKKITEKGVKVDKQVNFVARNPIACTGCHEDVDPVSHPGREPLAMPTKEICQKCHHGNIHGNFAIFKADCDDTLHTENCVKCHPYYNDYKKSSSSDNVVLR